MLHRLSYFNLLLSISYLLFYLKSGTFSSTAGIFCIIVFNWLYIRSYQISSYKWSILHYLLAAGLLYYLGKLVYSAIHIVLEVLEVDYLSNETLVFLIASLVLSAAVLFHLFGYWIKRNEDL